jgi:ferredoxin
MQVNFEDIQAVANQIKTIEAERDALAAQNLELRGVLEEALGRCRNSAEGAACREAVAEELEKLGPLGSSNQELFMVPWGEIKQRAAALRAGKGVQDA